MKMDSAILAANERMVYVTGDKEAIRSYEMRQMGLSDYNSSMNYARETGYAEGHADGMTEGITHGMAQGRAAGLQEGRNEEQLRLLEMLDQGLSIEEIKRRLTERI
jgi:flagellar biosynthesis/type III secretory pathway protein FliH